MKQYRTTAWTIEKEALTRLVVILQETSVVYGPAKTECGYDVTEITAPDMLTLEYGNTHGSWKKAVFPQTEVLFTYKKNERNPVLNVDHTRQGRKETVLLGIRPCDVMGIQCLDKVFRTNSLCDPYFSTRRDSMRIIALACDQPSPTCFCTSVGGAPDATTGADVILYDLSTRYFINVLTAAGSELVERVRTLLSRATSQDTKEKERVVKVAKQNIESLFNTEDLVVRMQDFDGAYWGNLHRKCLGCGICTFLCPTCHCFDITDENGGPHARRIRTWDSCMFPSFTVHASGHNPRPTNKERMRQRIMHKFDYTVKNHACTFCVGCGRCVVHCPVNLDIRQVLKTIQEGV